jgi:4-hydroxy 2-oxovalerate aldolase
MLDEHPRSAMVFRNSPDKDLALQFYDMLTVPNVKS